MSGNRGSQRLEIALVLDTFGLIKDTMTKRISWQIWHKQGLRRPRLFDVQSKNEAFTDLAMKLLTKEKWEASKSKVETPSLVWRCLTFRCSCPLVVHLENNQSNHVSEPLQIMGCVIHYKAAMFWDANVHAGFKINIILNLRHDLVNYFQWMFTTSKYSRCFIILLFHGSQLTS